MIEEVFGRRFADVSAAVLLLVSAASVTTVFVGVAIYVIRAALS